jgi:opacity protein-like surface antigen
MGEESMKKIVLVAFAALFAFSAPALAEIGQGNGEIGFNYGNTDYDSDTGLDSSDSLSLRGGYFMTRLFQVEGQYMSADATNDALGTELDASTDIMMVNGVFNFHPKKEITPYVLVGLGRADVTVQIPGASTDDSGMAYQVAAGSRFFFGKSKRTAFRVDLSMVNQDTFEESTTNTTFAGGFSWRLGK